MRRWMMPAELRIVIPDKLFTLLESKAKNRGVTLQDLVLYALTKVLEER